jgi:hypothetical protein
LLHERKADSIIYAAASIMVVSFFWLFVGGKGWTIHAAILVARYLFLREQDTRWGDPAGSANPCIAWVFLHERETRHFMSQSLQTGRGFLNGLVWSLVF